MKKRYFDSGGGIEVITNDFQITGKTYWPKADDATLPKKIGVSKQRIDLTTSGSQTLDFDAVDANALCYFIVGGGAGGPGDYNWSGTCSVGGWGGEVIMGELFDLNGKINISYTIGAGGNGGSNSTNMQTEGLLNGKDSSLSISGNTFTARGGFMPWSPTREVWMYSPYIATKYGENKYYRRQDTGEYNTDLIHTNWETLTTDGHTEAQLQSVNKWGQVGGPMWVSKGNQEKKVDGIIYIVTGDDGVPYWSDITNLYAAGGSGGGDAYTNITNYRCGTHGGKTGGGLCNWSNLKNNYFFNATKEERSATFYGSGGGSGTFSANHNYGYGGNGYQGIIILELMKV